MEQFCPVQDGFVENSDDCDDNDSLSTNITIDLDCDTILDEVDFDTDGDGICDGGDIEIESDNDCDDFERFGYRCRW